MSGMITRLLTIGLGDSAAMMPGSVMPRYCPPMMRTRFAALRDVAGEARYLRAEGADRLGLSAQVEPAYLAVVLE